MPHTLFISDLHLSADQPHSMAAFKRFISNMAPQAEALYILGDLFEYWAGDDDLDDPFHAEVTTTLRSLAAHGTRLYLLRGNRDLLIGEALAEACHATLLDDPSLIDLYGTPTLLSHGDTLCTDDTEYQRYRATVHDAEFQRQFLAKPLTERKAYIAQLRNRSMAEKQSKDTSIMDVNDAAVTALLREYHYPRLIHGHTHRQNCHEYQIDGRRCERWVLGDWHRQGSALRCDSCGITWETITD
ncbi:MAG: UDP-2,3-diacylglucosamine diphosphatase [Gallionellaceae bacterium]|nr:UDP-2,3-diacylglucosamine diphosphatase [Gallionellaceae bacterium]